MKFSWVQSWWFICKHTKKLIHCPDINTFLYLINTNRKYSFYFSTAIAVFSRSITRSVRLHLLFICALLSKIFFSRLNIFTLTISYLQPRIYCCLIVPNRDASQALHSGMLQDGKTQQHKLTWKAEAEEKPLPTKTGQQWRQSPGQGRLLTALQGRVTFWADPMAEPLVVPTSMNYSVTVWNTVEQVPLTKCKPKCFAVSSLQMVKRPLGFFTTVNFTNM